MTRILRLLLIAAIALPAWLGTAAETITVCGATPNVSSEFLPVYGYWMDTQGVETQMIYPSSKFNLEGNSVNKIDAITFYSTAAVPEALGGKKVIVRMGETYNTTISSRSEMISNRNNMDIVYQGTLTTGATEMTIEFQTAYVYQGNNIMIDFYVVENSTVTGEDCNWFGEVQDSYTAWNSKDGGEYFLPKLTITYSENQQQVVNFDTQSVGSTTTKTIDVANVTDYSLSPTPDADGCPFTVTKSGDTFTVKFNPTAATSYTGFLTVTYANGKNEVIKLKGMGVASSDGPYATRDKNFFKEITYTWQESTYNEETGKWVLNGPTHTSNLSEIATHPDQIIAMLRKVYMDQSIPGNWYRSNAKDSSHDSYNVVTYAGVGKIKRSGSSNNYTYSYSDDYGWNIPGTVEVSTSGYNNTFQNAHFKIDEYKPTYEGITLLLIEEKDDWKTDASEDNEYPLTHDYSALRDLFVKSVKSARVITEAKRTEQSSKNGTLFKIDCDKMNNFYLLAKGQLMEFYSNGGNYGYPNYNNNDYQDRGLNRTYLYYEPALYCHMFEQISPVVGNGTSAKEDIYALMLNMESFNAEHDCGNVSFIGHGFRMYDSDYSGDCADVRDMMLFMPDLRMMYEQGKDRKPSSRYSSDYFAYNTQYAPSMGMYVIDQKAITGEQVTVNGEKKEMYNLTLTWDSNLDEFLPGDNQVYYLYQVVVDEDGTEQYNPVYYMNSDGKYTDKNGTELTDQTKPVKIELEMSPSNVNKTYSGIYIPMLVSSQVVTFAVQGQDATKFLELKMSNTQDFVIPGLDPNEVVNLIDATHYSRFNPQTVKNCYSNRIEMKNAGLTHSQIVTSGDDATKLDIIRSCEGEDDVTVATITFTPYGSNGRLTWTVNMNNASQSQSSEYPAGKTSGTGAGYHANTTTSLSGNTQSSSGNINLGTNGIRFYDNFVVDVKNNDHPSSYSYTMKSNIKGAPAIYLKTKNGTTDYTVDGAIWYAYTWGNNGDAWVKGVKTDEDGVYAFFFDSGNTNLLFARVNPNGISNGVPASWDGSVVWNKTEDLNGKAVDGNTFTVTGMLTVSEPVAGDPAVMHSNSYRVPVYKTDSKINNVYTLEEVNGDNTGYTFENDDLTFQEKVQYSSKKDILRYDVYRWGENETRYIIDKVVTNNDNKESDISPNGQADNEDGWYTTKMNADAGESVTVPSGTTNWAVFVDDYPGSEESTEPDEVGGDSKPLAQAFTYAPVVEVFGKGKTSHSSTTDRTDYNTYGAPLSNAAVGEFELKDIEATDFQQGTPNALMSDHYWEVNGQKYSYYNIPLKFNAKEVPAGYEIYKIRVWREIDPSVLGEEFAVFKAGGARDRMTPVKQGETANTYLVADITYPATQSITSSIGSETQTVTVQQQNAISGETYDHEITYTLATFGAKRVRTNANETGVLDDPIKVGFFARIYFTRTANLASKAAAEGDYYMTESDVNYTITPNSVITGLVQNLNTREVVGVKYYNTLGIESDRPFDGVNIVVTRYSDGSTTSTKILK